MEGSLVIVICCIKIDWNSVEGTRIEQIHNYLRESLICSFEHRFLCTHNDPVFSGYSNYLTIDEKILYIVHPWGTIQIGRGWSRIIYSVGVKRPVFFALVSG